MGGVAHQLADGDPSRPESLAVSSDSWSDGIHAERRRVVSPGYLIVLLSHHHFTSLDVLLLFSVKGEDGIF